MDGALCGLDGRLAFIAILRCLDIVDTNNRFAVDANGHLAGDATGCLPHRMPFGVTPPAPVARIAGYPPSAPARTILPPRSGVMGGEVEAWLGGMGLGIYAKRLTKAGFDDLEVCMVCELSLSLPVTTPPHPSLHAEFTPHCTFPAPCAPDCRRPRS